MDDNNYWKIDAEDEYISISVEGDKIIAEDTRHDLSCWGESKEEALETLQEALKEYLLRKFVEKNETTTLTEIRESTDMPTRDLVRVVDILYDKGEIFEPQIGTIQIVPE